MMRLASALAMAALASPALAAFEEAGAGARSLGMGRAFAAIADDASAMFLNPAGPSQLARPELVAMYGRLHLGLTDESQISDGVASFAAPVRGLGTVAAAWHQLQLSNAYVENTFALGFSRQNLLIEGLHAGTNLKLLRRGFQEDLYTAIDPLFRNKGTTSSDLAVDLGLLYRPGRYTAALSALNVNRPDVGLGAEDRVPMELRAGFGYRLPNTAIGLDLSRRGGDTTAAFGGEFWLQGRFGTRGGFEFGSKSRKALNAGLSYRFSSFQMDYAFALPIGTIGGTNGSHRFSIAARFGRPAPQERGALEGEMSLEAAAQMEEMKRIVGEARGQVKAAEDRSLKLQNAVDVLQDQLRKPAPPSVEPSTGPTRENLMNQLDDMIERSRRQQEETEKLREQLKRLESELDKRSTPPAAAPPAAPARPTSYTVREGDTLQSIAEKVYGDPSRWERIYERNPDKVKRGGRVTPGTVLDLP